MSFHIVHILAVTSREQELDAGKSRCDCQDYQKQPRTAVRKDPRFELTSLLQDLPFNHESMQKIG